MFRISQRENIVGFLFISPWILGFLLFTLFPMIYSFVLAFYDWNPFGSPVWAGVKNYVTLFNDPLFWQSLKVTTIYSIGSVPLGLLVALLFAMLLNRELVGRGVFRTIFYMPSLVSGVAISVVWLWIFNSEFGLMNWVLSKFGIKGPQWLMSTTWALPALIIMSLWGTGNSMLIFLAGLQGLPKELYEVAELDGANSFQRFWKITLPLLSPSLFFNLVMGVIGSFQTFTQAYVMTQGGPLYSTLFYILYLYKNGFQYFKMGYASALAWVLFGIILVLTLLIFKSSPIWVYYEAEVKTPEVKR